MCSFDVIVAFQVVTGDGSRVPAILLANKCDLREESTVMMICMYFKFEMQASKTTQNAASGKSAL